MLHAARLRHQARLSRVPAVERAAAVFDTLGRYTQELAADLTPIIGAEEASRLAAETNEATLTHLLALEAA